MMLFHYCVPLLNNVLQVFLNVQLMLETYTMYFALHLCHRNWLQYSKLQLFIRCISTHRKLHEEESSETSSPPKRVSLHVTCQSFSKIKVEDDESTPELTAAQPTPCPDPPRRIIKVKRPAKIDGTTRDAEKVARTAGWTSGGSGKSSSGAVNGKVHYHVIHGLVW